MSAVFAHRTHLQNVYLQVKESLRAQLRRAEAAAEGQRAAMADLQQQLATAAKQHEAQMKRSAQQLQEAKAQAKTDAARAEEQLSTALQEHASETREYVQQCAAAGHFTCHLLYLQASNSV